MKRRTFLASVAAALSYGLVACGVTRPVFCVRRFLKCGNQVKLLFSQAVFTPTTESCLINGSVARGFGPLAGLLCRGFHAARQRDGSWRGVMVYDGDYRDAAIFLDGNRRRVFQMYERRWHSHLYGPLPDAEIVTPKEFDAA